MLGLSPWINTGCLNSVVQILLGTNSISILEVVSLLNITSISHYFIDYSNSLRSPKYNPRIYLGALSSVAETWNNNMNNPILNLARD